MFLTENKIYFFQFKVKHNLMNVKTANSYHRGPGGIINIMLCQMAGLKVQR